MGRRVKKLGRKSRQLIQKTLEDITPPTATEIISRAAADFIKSRLNEPSPIRQIFPVKEVKDIDG